MRLIRLGEAEFVADFGTHHMPIGLYPGPNGPYLRTRVDGTWNSRLLELKRCTS
jgi:hypothetical protein